MIFNAYSLPFIFSCGWSLIVLQIEGEVQYKMNRGCSGIDLGDRDSGGRGDT